MEDKIGTPYAGCKLSDVSEAFGINPTEYQPNGHTGVDFCPANAYGKFLAAPEDVKILKVINETIFGGDFMNDLARGFGLTMQSIANPDIVYLYWHCMQVIPVQAGQTVNQGQIVAQIGNSGMCYSNGVYVPLNDRRSGKGAHLHFERRDASKDPDYTDPLPHIDFTQQPKLNMIQASQQIIQGMINLLANRK